MGERDLHSHLADQLRRIRTERGWSQDDLAGRARKVGLDWQRSTVADLETGRGSLGIEDLILLPLLLETELSDLLDTDDRFQVGRGTTTFKGKDIARLLAGRSHDVPTLGKELREQEKTDIAGEAEHHLARALGRDVEDIVKLSYLLWGKSLSEERDHRLAEDRPGSLAQRRGHVTRQLRQEIEQTLLSRTYIDKQLSKHRHPSRRRKR